MARITQKPSSVPGAQPEPARASPATSEPQAGGPRSIPVPLLKLHATGMDPAKAPEAAPEPTAFTCALHVDREGFLAEASDRGIPEYIATSLWRLSGAKVRTAPVAELLGGALRPLSVARALDHVRHTGRPMFYVECELLNLKGLNAKLGTSGANLLLNEVAKLFSVQMNGTGGAATVFRNGGPSISAVVHSPLGKEVVDAALVEVKQQVAALVARWGLQGLEHPAHTGDERYRGVRVALGVAPLGKEDTVQGVLERAQAAAVVDSGLPQTDAAPSAPPRQWNSLGRWLPAQAVRARAHPRNHHDWMDGRERLGHTFRVTAESRGVPADQVDALWAKAGIEQHTTDPLTGFQTGTFRVETVVHAQQHVRETGDQAFYVECDVRNLSGLNLEVGREGADEVFANTAEVVRAALEALDAKVSAFRHGGDEISFVVVSSEEPIEAVEKALAQAQALVAQRVREAGLADIPHPKHPDQPGLNGTGIVYGLSEILGDGHPDAVFSEADQAVERNKHQQIPVPDAPP
jgi:GGDEF domain-containing protein